IRSTVVLLITLRSAEVLPDTTVVVPRDVHRAGAARVETLRIIGVVVVAAPRVHNPVDVPEYVAGEVATLDGLPVRLVNRIAPGSAAGLGRSGGGLATGIRLFERGHLVGEQVAEAG